MQFQDECYRDDCARLHWETVHYNLHRFQQAYSEELAGLVELMLSREEKARPDWLQLEERVIREEENKTVSLLNISKDTRSSQLPPRLSGVQQQHQQQTAFMTSQVVPLYQASNSGSVSQRHSHLYRPKPPLPTHHHAVSEVTSRFTPPPLPVHLEQSARVVCIAPSFIESTRPLRSVFPLSTYTTQTKIDENLIVVAEEEGGGFDAETPNNRNNSTYFDSNLKSAVENSLPLYQPPLYHTYTPPPSAPLDAPLVNTYGVSFFPSHSPPSPPPPAPPSQQGEFVVERYKQGSEYKGFKVEGMRHGQGVFYYQDGGMYEGEWRLNKMQGRGKLFYQSGKLAYEGDWANDQFSGAGVLYNEYPDVLNHPINYKDLDEVEEFWTKYEGTFSAMKGSSART